MIVTVCRLCFYLHNIPLFLLPLMICVPADRICVRVIYNDGNQKKQCLMQQSQPIELKMYLRMRCKFINEFVIALIYCN